MTRTAYGFLHVASGKDMDGSNRTFEWIEAEPQKFDMTDAEFEAYEEKAGWFAMCEVGWIGPMETQEEAIELATNEDKLHKWQWMDFE